ncbi:hypothetical protein LPB41_12960 [Thalassospira sp. MA62]|nr:hypothetical protein [Thalassospira sp. MA62]
MAGKIKTNKGAMLLGGRSNNNREAPDHEFYPNRPKVTEALLRAVRHLAFHIPCKSPSITTTMEGHGTAQTEIFNFIDCHMGWARGTINLQGNGRWCERLPVEVGEPPTSWKRFCGFIEQKSRCPLDTGFAF